MNTSDIDLLLLLESSGELTPEQRKQLEKAEKTDPGLAARREEIAVLQRAGRRASADAVPDLPDTRREAIRQQATKAARRGPGPWLAIAALLVIGLALWPHLTRTGTETMPAPATMADTETDPADTILEEDAVLAGLRDLDQTLQDFGPLGVNDVLEPDADFWAEQLLQMEDS